ncbi:MAG: hypothetical protein DCC52_06210 [Chloroflexi bacterium]|nr:MAG: hypothetical protein DCC52_06210 [Chloroflexota bacterium]
MRCWFLSPYGFSTSCRGCGLRASFSRRRWARRWWADLFCFARCARGTCGAISTVCTARIARRAVRRVC